MLRKLVFIIGLLLIPLTDVGETRDVFHGDLRQYQNGAVVDIHAAFAAITEYQEIENRGLTPEDADYYVLLARANERFYAAIRVVARQGNYDMIARKNSVGVQNLDLPDITEAVVSELTADK